MSAAVKGWMARGSLALRRVGDWLTPPVLLAAGVMIMFVATALPFYAPASARLPAPGFWEPWSTGALENRWLLLTQGIGVTFAALTLIRRKSRALRLLAGMGVACAFWATWLLAAERARELLGAHLSVGDEWQGVGLGAGLFLVGAAIVVAAGVRNGDAAVGRAWRRAIGGTLAWAVALVGVGLAATKAWDQVGLERFGIEASVVAVHDVCGLEIPGSVAVQLEVTNQGPQPVVIVARRGGQYASLADGKPIYWLRMKTRSRDNPHWRRLQQPAWSGPWPRLDFQSSRDLDTAKSWALEAPVYRKDITLIRGGRPDEVMVELTDGKRRWFVRRIVAVTPAAVER